MKDVSAGFSADLSGLNDDEWLDQFEDLAEDYGYFEPLGPDHSAAFIDAGSTLFVSFTTLLGAQKDGQNGLPFGYDRTTTDNWSQLTLMSHGNTWFRDRWVYRFFDRLVDDGFFDDYETVVFYGAQAAGYAAAAFSVAAPGCTVIAVSPQATLATDRAGWDTRFVSDRHRDFTSRYGYAPDMVEAADQVFLIYDPLETADAMHASLFHCENVRRLKTRFLGKKTKRDLLQSGLLPQIVDNAAGGTLSTLTFAKLWRARFNRPIFLRGLLNWCDKNNRDYLGAKMCETIVRTQPNRPYFEERLQKFQADGFIERESA